MSPYRYCFLLITVCLPHLVSATPTANDESPESSVQSPQPQQSQPELPAFGDREIEATCEQIVDEREPDNASDRDQSLSQCIADAEQFVRSLSAME